MTKVVGINGSLRSGSVTGQMVQQVLEGARQQGADVDMVQLSDYSLPFCDGRSDSYGATVESLKERLEHADVLVVGTPEYHGGYSGALKNFLDLMPSKVFKDKLVGLVGAAGGCLGGAGALNQLQLVFRNLGAWVMPSQTNAGGSDSEKSTLTNPKILARLSQMGNELAVQAPKFST